MKRLGEPANPRLGTGDTVLVWLIFVHYLVFELLFFFYPDFLGPLSAPVTLWKSLFPVVLCCYGLGDAARALENRPILAVYTVLFGALLAIACVSSVLSPLMSSGLYEWMKLPPRLLFFIGAAGFFCGRPQAFVMFAKIVVGWALLSAAQYTVLVLVGGYRFQVMLDGIPVPFAGRFGELGNVSSLISPPGLPFSIPRLCGYWNEPSNASATMFASFFLSRYLHKTGAGHFWRIASFACLGGGIACFSNAGYTAFSCGIAFLLFFPAQRRTIGLLKSLLVVAVAVTFIFAGLYGRTFVAEHMPNNEYVKAFVGVRVDLANLGFEAYDPFSGRLDLIEVAVSQVVEHPLGIGVVTSGREGDTLSASAPVTWFAYTGVVGLIILLAREAVLATAAFSFARRQPLSVELCQAWIVVLVQQTSYGLWMSPFYMVLSAAILVGTMPAMVPKLRRPRQRYFEQPTIGRAVSCPTPRGDDRIPP